MGCGVGESKVVGWPKIHTNTLRQTNQGSVSLPTTGSHDVAWGSLELEILPQLPKGYD